MVDGNDGSRDDTNNGETICEGRGNGLEASGADGVPEGRCPFGGAERRERAEALMDWRRDTERLVKGMRNALPPGHPLRADADRWLDYCDYWIEDIMADRELPPLEPGEGRFEWPFSRDGEEGIVGLSGRLDPGDPAREPKWQRP